MPVASDGLYSMVLVDGLVAYAGMRMAALRFAAEKKRFVGASKPGRSLR